MLVHLEDLLAPLPQLARVSMQPHRLIWQTEAASLEEPSFPGSAPHIRVASADLTTHGLS